MRIKMFTVRLVSFALLSTLIAICFTSTPAFACLWPFKTFARATGPFVSAAVILGVLNVGVYMLLTHFKGASRWARFARLWVCALACVSLVPLLESFFSRRDPLDPLIGLALVSLFNIARAFCSQDRWQRIAGYSSLTLLVVYMLGVLFTFGSPLLPVEWHKLNAEW